MEDDGTANDDADVVVDGPNDVAIDKDTSDRCQGARNNRDHCLKDLKKDKERWPEDTCLENKSRQGFLGLEDASKVGPDTESKGCQGPNDGGPINDFLEERGDLPQFFFFCYHNSSAYFFSSTIPFFRLFVSSGDEGDESLKRWYNDVIGAQINIIDIRGGCSGRIYTLIPSEIMGNSF